MCSKVKSWFELQARKMGIYAAFVFKLVTGNIGLLPEKSDNFYNHLATESPALIQNILLNLWEYPVNGGAS